MLSASKIFSYAGQRIALACVSDKLFDTQYPHWQPVMKTQVYSGRLHRFYHVYDYLRLHGYYQYAMAEMLEKSISGEINL